MAKNKHIEELVSDTLLQTPIEVTIAGHRYAVAPPTIATLAMASKEIAKIPVFDPNPQGDIVLRTLSFAKYAAPIARVVAILIEGAKCDERARKWRKWGIHIKSRIDIVARELLLDAQPSELSDALAKLLGSMQVTDFFALSASLSKVNILTPTIKTAETTVFGQS